MIYWYWSALGRLPRPGRAGDCPLFKFGKKPPARPAAVRPAGQGARKKRPALGGQGRLASKPAAAPGQAPGAPTLPGTPVSTPRPAPSSGPEKLGDILSAVLAGREEEEVGEQQRQQLVFFNKQLDHVVLFLRSTPALSSAEGAQDTLQQILDSAAKLNELLGAMCSAARIPVEKPSAETPFEEAGLAGLFEEAGLGEQLEGNGDRASATDASSLEADLEGLLYEVQTIRAILADSTDLASLLEPEGPGVNQRARDEIKGMASRTAELLQECLDALSKLPAAPAKPQGEPESLAPASDRLLWAQAEPAPPAQGPAPSATPPPLPDFPPVSAIGGPAPGEQKGLALAEDGPQILRAADPEAPPEEDYSHKSENEALKSLQGFFNDNSPSGAMLRPKDPEFERMIKSLLGVLHPDVVFEGSDFVSRLRLLKNTFALRKRLSNSLTVEEFDAFFKGMY